MTAQTTRLPALDEVLARPGTTIRCRWTTEDLTVTAADVSCVRAISPATGEEVVIREIDFWKYDLPEADLVQITISSALGWAG